MAIATLTIDLVARLAGIETSLNRASQLAEKNAVRMQRAFDGVSGSVSRMSAIFGRLQAVGAVLGLKAGIEGIAESTVGAVASLDDLADKTALSVEFLSSLQRTTLVVGGDIDALSNSAAVLARNLANAAGGDTQTLRYFQGLGVQIRDANGNLRSFDNVFRDTIKSLAEADNKTFALAYGNKLLGKSYADNAATLRDINEVGLQAGRVTAEQAAQAELLTRQWGALKLAASDAGQALGTTFVPKILEAIEDMREGIRIAGGFWSALKLFGTIDPFQSIGKNVAELESKLDSLERARANNGGRFQAMIDAQIEATQKKLQFLYAQLDKLSGITDGADGGGDVSTPRKLAAPPVENEEAENRKRLAERLYVAKQIQEGEEDAAKEASEAWEAFSQQENKRAQDRLDMAKDINDQWVKLIDAQLDAEREAGLAANGGKSGTEKMADDLEKSKKEAEELSRQFAPITSEIEDAFVEGKKFNDILGSIGDTIERLAIRKLITEPLGDATNELLKMGKSAASNIDWGSVGSAISNFFAADGAVFSGPMHAFALGDVVHQPQFFKFASGSGFRTGVMGEAGPEAIMPLARDAQGRLGVRAQMAVRGGDAGAGGLTVNIYEAPGTRARVQQRQTDQGAQLDVIMDQVEESLSARMQRGQGLAPTMERLYGLNRAAGAVR